MKKVFLLLLLALPIAFTSCEKEEGGNNTKDPIIGKWVHYEFYVNGVKQEVGECDKKNSITFKEDKTFVSESFSERSDGSCNPEGTVSGVWKSLDNSTYRVTATKIDGKDIPKGEGKDIVITVKNTTFSFENKYGEETYKEVWKKVN